MSRVARFRVVGTFDMASAAQVATVEIDRDVGTISVRPLRRKRKYELPLSYVAALICRQVVAAEVRLTKAAKAMARKARKEERRRTKREERKARRKRP